jgi:TatD DNase family protein
MFIDSHAHLASSAESYDNLDDVIKRAKSAGLTKVVDAGIDIKTSKAVIQLAKKYPDFIIPTVGIQPEVLVPGSDIYNDVGAANLQPGFRAESLNQQIKQLKQMVTKHRDVIGAIGETGLDYYWINKDKQLNSATVKQIKADQLDLFTKQVELAKEFELPIVVHSRGAEQECLRIINEQLTINNKIPSPKSQIPGALFHCFTGTKQVAEQVLAAGHYMSFNGILTYKNAGNVREIFKIGWEEFRDQILVESDAPLLMPRGVQVRTPEPTIKRVESTVNEPGNVPVIVAKMAEIVGCDIEEIAEVTTENAMRFYGIK